MLAAELGANDRFLNDRVSVEDQRPINAQSFRDELVSRIHR